MSERPYELARIADLADARGWSPIRFRLGVRSFGINAWTAAEAGGRLISEHDEVSTSHEELYLVTEGRATFSVDGEEVDAPAGTIVFVPGPGRLRAAVAVEPGTQVLAVGGAPGAIYRPQAWEVNARVSTHFERGEYAEAKAILSSALDDYEDTSGLYYDLACAEARLGETDAALEHLRLAVTARPAFAPHAQTDPDLEAVRGDPRFAVIVGT